LFLTIESNGKATERAGEPEDLPDRCPWSLFESVIALVIGVKKLGAALQAGKV